MKNIIDVKNVSKKFGSFTAVDNISFKVKKGEIFAFLGPNGAGKSTTIKMLTTLVEPTKGEIKVNNFTALNQKDEVRKSIGVIFQDHTLDDDLTAYENLKYHAQLYGLKKDGLKERIEELLDFVGLLTRKDELLKRFSGGMKRRIEIARGLIHSPEVLFLDEPTLGLDVQTRAFLWEYIEKLNVEKEMTIFLTTHNLDEAEKVATNIAIIDKGKILIQGSAEDIKKETKTKSLEDAFLKLTGKSIRNSGPEGNEIGRRFAR